MFGYYWVQISFVMNKCFEIENECIIAIITLSMVYQDWQPFTFKSTDIVSPELCLLCEGNVLCVGVEGGHDDLPTK